MNEDLAIPDAIYFDTNPLIAAGWPTPSPQLLEIIDQAERLGSSLCLPIAVKMELEEHWYKELQQKWRDLKVAAQNANRKAAGLATFQTPPVLPSKDELLSGIRLQLAEFNANFRTVPLTNMTVEGLLVAAIARDATFKDHGHGFQDAVILYSVLDHMKSEGYASALLVSEDQAFTKDTVNALALKAGKILQVVRNLDELGTLFKKHFTAMVLAHMNQEKQRLVATVSDRRAELELFLNQNFAVDQASLGVIGTVKKMNSIQVIKIEDAHRSRAWWLGDEPKDDKRLKVSFDVKVMLHLEVERYSATPTPRLKVGEHQTVQPDLLEFFRSPQGADEYKETVLTVEAEVTDAESGYQDLKFLQASVKQEHSLLSAFSQSVGATS